MADVRIEHIYDCSEDTFWDKVFFDDEYNRRLFLDALQFPKREVVKREDGETEVRQTIELTPKLGPMPAPLKKLVGEGLGYREEGVYDKKARRYTVRIYPNKLADKLTITGEMSSEPAGDGKMKRIYKGTVVAKIFGVGGLLEKTVIADIEKSYSESARFTNQYLKEKGLS
jgi:hypothetical protein